MSNVVEIHNCIGCGRDTKRKSQLCNVCDPATSSSFQAGNENFGRSARDNHFAQSPIDLDDMGDDFRPLRHDLM